MEKAVQGVLDARNLYPECTLADLYDPNTMSPELVKAHEKLDKAVKDAYGKNGFDTEEEIVASLMKMYKEVTHIEKIESAYRKIERAEEKQEEKKSVEERAGQIRRERLIMRTDLETTLVLRVNLAR